MGSAAVLATVSSSNQVGCKNLTVAVRHLISSRRLWYTGGTIQAGINTFMSLTVRGPGYQLVVAMMCDADVCGLIPTTRLKRVFEWGVKQAPREAPDSEC